MNIKNLKIPILKMDFHLIFESKDKEKSVKIKKQQKGKIMCNVTVLLICFYGPTYFYFRIQHFGWKYIQLTSILGGHHMSNPVLDFMELKRKACVTPDFISILVTEL